MDKKTEALKLAQIAMRGIWAVGLTGNNVRSFEEAMKCVEEALAEQPAQQKIGVCGEKRGACGLPCEPCEGKTDPDYVQQPAQQHPDLSHLRPETQEAIRGWIKDGTFFDRAIGTMHDQEKRLMAYEKAQHQGPLTGGDERRHIICLCPDCTKPAPATELREQQEPVAWVDLIKQADEIVRGKPVWKRFIDGTPLANDIAVWMADFAQQLTSPPASKPWVGLTDEDARELRETFGIDGRIIRAIEAKLREKNS